MLILKQHTVLLLDHKYNIYIIKNLSYNVCDGDVHVIICLYNIHDSWHCVFGVFLLCILALTPYFRNFFKMGTNIYMDLRMKRSESLL